MTDRQNRRTRLSVAPSISHQQPNWAMFVCRSEAIDGSRRRRGDGRASTCPPQHDWYQRLISKYASRSACPCSRTVDRHDHSHSIVQTVSNHMICCQVCPPNRETPTSITSKSYAADFAGRFGRKFFPWFRRLSRCAASRAQLRWRHPHNLLLKKLPSRHCGAEAHDDEHYVYAIALSPTPLTVASWLQKSGKSPLGLKHGGRRRSEAHQSYV